MTFVGSRHAAISHVAFAAIWIALGIQGFVKADFTVIWRPVPDGAPAREALVYLCASISLACGIGLLWRRTAALAAVVLLAALILWFLLWRVHAVFRSPIVEGTWPCGETMVMAAGAWILFTVFATDRDRRHLGFAAGDDGVRIARVLYGLGLLPFGYAHFAYFDHTAEMVPGWLPGHSLWASFTGCAFIAAGAAIVTGVCARLAAVLSALMMGLFGLLVWLPRVAAGGLDAFQWGEVVSTLALTAAGWVVAESYRGRPWIGVGQRTWARPVAAIVIVGASLSNAEAREGVRIRPGTEVRFADAAEGSRVLSSPDVFVRAMSPYDRSARLKTDKDVSEAEYLGFVGRQTRDWTSAEEARIRPILEQFRAKTADLDFPLPPTILFIKTTGLEEGNAAYCRGAAVVLPTKYVEGDPGSLQEIVFHELFHVYRTHNPAKRRDLYRIIGFDVCPEIALPKEIRSRKLTNPDAPLIDSFIRLRSAGGMIAVTPVLFARTDRYDTKTGGEFFQSMVFRLMVLDEKDGLFVAAVLPGGGADLRDPAQVSDYLERIGKNTNYVIHPEEILAENFVLMLNGASSVPSPNIVQELRTALTR